jgi:hypothetical protein
MAVSKYLPGLAIAVKKNVSDLISFKLWVDELTLNMTHDRIVA